MNLTVAVGEVVAVCGRSGSGKSTLLKLIAGLESPKSGSVSVGALDVARLSDSARRRLRRDTVSFVYQDHNLIPELTAGENVMLAADLQRGVSAEDSRKQAHAALETLDMDHLFNKLPDELSGGESQRVAIARALSRSSSVVLADEPTGSLDAENAEAVMTAFSNLAAGGSAVLIATHDPEVITRADRALYLAHGMFEGRS